MLEIIIIIASLLLDQGTKVLAHGALPGLPGASYPLIEGVFHFTYLENTGAAFGIMAGMRPVFLVLTTIACGVIIFTLIFRRKKLNLWMRVSLSLIVAGALGNYIDRIFLGYVRDFLHFALIDFAIFNVADACITVGTVLFAVYVLLIADRKKEGRAEKLDEPVSNATKPDIAPTIKPKRTSATEIALGTEKKALAPEESVPKEELACAEAASTREDAENA